MNATWTWRWIAHFSGILVMIALGAGCQTIPKIDWAARVGAYSYDQAVRDFGPPNRSAKLTDGSTVAEWITQRSYSRTYMSPGFAGFMYGYPYGGPGPLLLDTYSPEYVLRLTFGPDGQLAAWKKVVK